MLRSLQEGRRACIPVPGSSEDSVQQQRRAGPVLSFLAFTRVCVAFLKGQVVHRSTPMVSASAPFHFQKTRGRKEARGTPQVGCKLLDKDAKLESD